MYAVIGTYKFDCLDNDLLKNLEFMDDILFSEVLSEVLLSKLLLVTKTHYGF